MKPSVIEVAGLNSAFGTPDPERHLAGLPGIHMPAVNQRISMRRKRRQRGWLAAENHIFMTGMVLQ